MGRLGQAIDAQLGLDDEAEQRRAAGVRLLAQPMPTGYDREPDWDEVKEDMLDDRRRRMYPDAE